jgi:hypothetical protein
MVQKREGGDVEMMVGDGHVRELASSFTQPRPTTLARGGCITGTLAALLTAYTLIQGGSSMVSSPVSLIEEVNEQ